MFGCGFVAEYRKNHSTNNKRQPPRVAAAICRLPLNANHERLSLPVGPNLEAE